MSQELKLINNKYSTHFGVVSAGVLKLPELPTGLFLLVSFGHFLIPEGFKKNSHGCNPWNVSVIESEPRSGFNHGLLS